MKIEKFEDLISWQKAETLTLEIYKIFRMSKDFGFKDQIQRATVSIMNNIAEGFERRGDKEFSHFLYISKGSCGEVRSMLHLALKLGYISEENYKKFIELATDISRLLSGFIKKLNN